MNEFEIDLTTLVPDFPEIPNPEISRDALINRINHNFRENNRKQIIISDEHYGKTNLLSQYCRKYANNTISYFFTSNKLTHHYRTYLYVVCKQMSKLLGEDNISSSISENDLENIYTGLKINLADFLNSTKQDIFFVIDGIDHLFDSELGNKIINHPPTQLNRFNFLISVNRETLEKLPEDWKKAANIRDLEEALLFNLHDIESYMSGCNLNKEEIVLIMEKYQGIAGCITILRDTIKSSGKELVFSEELPDNIKYLIESQVTKVRESSSEELLECLDLISVSPKPLNAEIIIGFTKGKVEINQLLKTGLIKYEQNSNELSIKQDLTKTYIQNTLGNRKKQVTEVLLTLAKKSKFIDDELITLLLSELKDYDGLRSLLSIKTIHKAFDEGKIALILDRLRLACKIATKDKNLEETIRMCWNLAAIKEFLTPASSVNEINALISIGESKQALELAYSFPEKIGKIRLLAKIYSSMKDRHEHVSKKAIEELELMLEGENIVKLEKEIIQNIAFDILPVLPEKAISLLDNIVLEKKQDLIDVTNTSKLVRNIQSENILAEDVNNRLEVRKEETRLINKNWLQKSNLANLINFVDDIKNTKAKEYLIRQWCLHTSEYEELPFGIEYWLNTVIKDDTFTIPLRNLRQLSKLIKSFPETDRRRLINYFNISAKASLETPKEEWVGFQLNLAEAMYDYAADEAKSIINIVYETINTEINDFDIKMFCYARLWATNNTLDIRKVDDIKSNFERVLSSLLDDSALQDEILEKTIKIISEIDINYAFEVSNRVNMKDRRFFLKKLALNNAYLTKSDEDLSPYLREIIKDFDSYQTENFIYFLLEDISENSVKVDEESQKELYYKTIEMKDCIKKSISFINLASIWTNERINKAEYLLLLSKESWRNENDLRKKIIVGFQLVEKISNINKSLAIDLCKEIQSILINPGAELALGNLGVLYFNSIKFLIRSLDSNYINDENLQRIFSIIDKLPSVIIRNELYTQLVARLYTLELDHIAKNIVEEKILKVISSPNNNNLLVDMVYFSLPVIFKYRQRIAFGLIKRIPKSKKDLCWLNVLLWIIARGQIGDFDNFETFKKLNSADILRDEAFVALAEIKQDAIIYTGVDVLASSIEFSTIHKKLDPVNAHKILSEIDDLIINNEDKDNITHSGYKIISQVRVNGSRSRIYKNLTRKSKFNKMEIRDNWINLERTTIDEVKNIADKVYVLTYLAKEMFDYDHVKAEKILDSLSADVMEIPALLDRLDRFDFLAKAWGKWGRIKNVEFYYNRYLDMMKELDSWTQDQKLDHLIQAAYEINEDLADELLEKLDSRYDDKVLNPPNLKLQTLKYSRNLRDLSQEETNIYSNNQGSLIKDSVNIFLNKYLSGDEVFPPEETIINLIYKSSYFQYFVLKDVIKLAIEYSNSKIHHQNYGLSENFLESSKNIIELARWISPASLKGIHQDYYYDLPGLSPKIQVFNSGDQIIARKWIKNWIHNNVEDKLKLCDPYFGPRELWVFSDMPRDIKIYVITTSKKFESKNDPEEIKNELITSWKNICKGSCPNIKFWIVPEELEKTFHDRAIVSKNHGIKIGPSLNGLANEKQVITLLEYDEAISLETEYMNDMLHTVKWNDEHDIDPIFIELP